MKALIGLTYQLVLIHLFLQSTSPQNIASTSFVSDQIILWNGNNVVQYQQTATPYQFTSSFVNPPTTINRIFPILNGFHFLNQNRISFSVTALMTNSSTGTYTIDFIPLNSIIFYQVAFTMMGITSNSSELLYLDRYYLTPSVLNNSTRAPATNQETFTLISGIAIADGGFQIRNFLSFFDTYHSNGITGVVITPTSSYVTGSYQFDVTVIVQAGSELYLCSIVVIVINKNALLIHHSQFAISGIQILQNFQSLPDTTLVSYTSSKFSIPSVYGPTMSRNCSIGFYGIYVYTDTSIKSAIFDYNSSTGVMNVINALGGGGVMVNYQALCIIDCTSDGFYSSALQKCDYCYNYITFCKECTSTTLCTNCGTNSFFDNINQRCSCKFGVRVIGGCTSIAACLSIDDIGRCLSCKPGYTLSLNSLLCQCPSGFHLAGWACTNVNGCITAAVVNGTSKCFACNNTLHFKMDGNGGCECGAGHTLYNGACVTLCGNGELFGLEQCDDGNHIEGDGCSSVCQVQTSYVCNNTGSSSQSICTYKTEFAQINLVQSFRDNEENAGYFIFTVQPAISNLNKMDFTSAINISCASKISAPQIGYSDGVLKIKVIFLQNIENKMMNITLRFNQTIVLHKPISSVFDIKSLNSPMTLFSKFPQYDFINLYLKILSVFAVLVFMVGSWTHKMIGVETIHIFQFIFFTSIYEVTYSDLFISSFRSLRFTANYPDIFYDEMIGLKQGDIFQSLMFAFSFVGNYYIIGTVTFIIIFIFIIIYLFKMYKSNLKLQQQQRLHQPLQENLAQFDIYYQIRKETLYSIAFFPIVVGYYLQCFFAVQAQLYRKSSDKTRLTYITNSILSIMFIWMASFTIFRQIFFNLRYNVKSIFYNVQNRYIALYLINILLNIVFFNFSDRFQYDLTSMASYNIAYFLIILFYRPYQHHLHNFHILYNQLIYILWIILLIYQDRATNKLSDDNKYFVLTGFISALSLSLLISVLRIILQIVEKGHQKQKIKKYFKHEQQRTINLKRRSERRIKNILRRDVDVMAKYWIQDQQRLAIQKNHELINAERNILGMGNLFEPRKEEALDKYVKKNTSINEEIQGQTQELKQRENRKWRREVELQQIKTKLRQNLLKYKQKNKQKQRQEESDFVRKHF